MGDSDELVRGTAEQPASRRRLRAVLVRSVLVLVALGLSVVLAEMVLRVSGLVPGRGGIYTVTQSEFDRVPGIFGPNQDAEVNTIPELRYRVRINTLGYRGEDFPLSKPEGETRIFFVGDSFVYGDFVGEEGTLPVQLERLLRPRCSSPVRVINAGVGASSITEQREMVSRGLQLDPDIVLLLFSENDVTDLAGIPLWEDLESNRRVKGAFPLSIVYPLVRGSALWNLSLQALGRFRQRRNAAAVSEAEIPDANQSSGRMSGRLEGELRTQYLEYLKQLDADLRAVSIPLVVAVMPSHLSVYDRRDSDQLAWFDQATAEAGIDAISFYPTFRDDGRDEAELYLLPYDGHASPEGYRLAAGPLAEFLLRSGALSRACP